MCTQCRGTGTHRGDSTPCPCAEDPGPAPGTALPGGSSPSAAEPFHRDLLPPACPQHRRPPGPGSLPVPAFPRSLPVSALSRSWPLRMAVPPSRSWQSRTLLPLERCPGSLEGLRESWGGTATLPGHPCYQDTCHTRTTIPPRHPFHQSILPGRSAPFKLKG